MQDMTRKSEKDTTLEVQSLARILKKNGIETFKYYIEEDRMLVFNGQLEVSHDISGYLSYLRGNEKIRLEERRMLEELVLGRRKGPIKLHLKNQEGFHYTKVMDAVSQYEKESGCQVIVGSVQNVTESHRQHELLLERIKQDPLTGLYNQTSGKELINEYLGSKNPYESCGMMVLDIDYFKAVNDTYGHLFGDQVLLTLAKLLSAFSRIDDVVMRAGGDEFVVLFKDISNEELIRKASELLQMIRRQIFPEKDYCMTCSIGVCFVPENSLGYSYNQIFEDADWALYRAKEGGRDRYAFCDTLKRFVLSSKKEDERHPSLDARYLHNDIISTAFEIFEKTYSFQSAMELLMEVVGLRFQLDRITVIQTNVKAKNTEKIYQWTAEGIPEALASLASFTKDDFLTLFHSYDEYGTTVLQHDQMDAYSKDAQELLMQGDAKTVLYAAMYWEGKYTGAISYVVCDNKRCWSKVTRKQFGELTKIISVYLSRHLATNAVGDRIALPPEYDALTGLMSFGLFCETTERLIVGEYRKKAAMIYTDFHNFKYFNQKYGYSEGDRLLKSFCNFVLDWLWGRPDICCTRVVADQFVAFMPCEDIEQLKLDMEERNRKFQKQYMERYPKIELYLRTGIFAVTADCAGASQAIDAANYARQKVKAGSKESVRIYDEDLGKKQQLENEILNGMNTAIENREFQVYLQPRYSLKEQKIVGAEALIRWQRKNGEFLQPAHFIPLYEDNGKIVELDFYVFEEVVRYLAKNQELGRKQIPISINASVLHALEDDTVNRYLEILNRYHVDPSLTEIELTETATVSMYDSVCDLFARLQKEQLMTALDDFGAGYSVLNTVIDIPVNTIKLDRLFLKNCGNSEKGIYLIQHIVAIVKKLGYHVVCEGVETEEQVALLQQIGCDEVQGNWFSKAIPIKEFEALLYAREN